MPVEGAVVVMADVVTEVLKVVDVDVVNTDDVPSVPVEADEIT